MTAQEKKMIEEFFENPHTFGWYLGYDKLTPVHSQWIKYLFFTDRDRTLQAHRNSYKTTCIVIGVILLLLLDPNLTIAIIRKSESGASSILQEIEKHYLSEKVVYIYSILGINFKLSDYNQKQLELPNRTKISKEKNIEIFGKGGNITGSHFHLVITDDIVTDKDRYSKAERESTKNYIRELYNIKKIDGWLIGTGTPWHEDDAFKILPKPLMFPLGTVPLKTEDLNKIKELEKKMPSTLFACNYHLKHIADKDTLIPDMQFVKWDETLTASAWLDPGYGGECTTGLTIIQQKDGKYIISGYVYHDHIIDCALKIKNKLEEKNCITQLYESNGVDKERKKVIMDISPIFRGIASTDNKHYRITVNVKRNLENILFDEDCQMEYLEQLKNYTDGEIPNEAPDSLASLLRELDNMHGVEEEQTKAEDVSEDFQY